MIVYEVNLTVAREIENEYRTWLQAHIQEILKIDGFESAEVFSVEDEGESLNLCVQYRLRTREDLEGYFKNHAPRLRAEGIEKFGDKFTASRRVLKL